MLANAFRAGDIFCHQVVLGGSLYTSQILQGDTAETHGINAEKFKLSVSLAVSSVSIVLIGLCFTLNVKMRGIPLIYIDSQLGWAVAVKLDGKLETRLNLLPKVSIPTSTWRSKRRGGIRFL